MIKKLHNNSGFTLIELLMVISIISLLASVVFSAVDSAREGARDAKRKADLESIVTALALYHSDTGTYRVSNGGCCGGTGRGWYNYENGGTYPDSISDLLISQGYISGTAHDPQVPPSTTLVDGQRAYMVYEGLTGSIDTSVCVFANLENPSDADLATLDDSTIDLSAYSMNVARCIN